jgi:hypothetical protein
MVYAFVAIGAAVLIAVVAQIQLGRRRDSALRGQVMADPVQEIISVDVKPKVQFGNWGKTLAAMQLQLRVHSFSIILNPKIPFGSALGSEWHFVWASSGLTDIHHQGHSPGKDVQNGDHGEEEAPSPPVVHTGVQG